MVSLMLRVVDLESRHRKGQLTVSHLTFELDDTVRIVEILHEIVTMIDQVRDCGRVLDILSELGLKYRHIGSVKNACDAILIAGYEPYISVITDYCVRGSTSSDVFDEVFMKRIHSESLVEGLRSCPGNFKQFSTHILRAGKNMSFARSLGCDLPAVAVPTITELIQEEYKAVNFFNDCVAKSSNVLYEAVSRKTPIGPVIKWFKEYLLLTKSDWFTQFVQQCLGELEKPTKLVDLGYLNELLHQLPGSPICEIHAFQIEDMYGPGGSLRTLADIKREELENSSLPAMKAFTLKPTTIDFHQTMFLTDSTVFKFQTVFRILSFSRIVGMKLSQVWLDFQSLQRIGDGCVLFGANMLLKRMSHFVENFLFHLNVDVVAERLGSMDDLMGVHDIDELKESIEQLIDEILARCLITPACVRSVNKVLGTCNLFASHMNRFVSVHASTADDELIRITEEEQYIGLIAKFEDAFDGQMNSLLVQLKHYVSSDRERAQALVAKIDYNDYYSNKIGL